jgi:transitional endoplasmic reticulum ATPase
MAATSDDLLSLLSIHRACSEPHRQDPAIIDDSHQNNPSINSNDWGQVVITLPQQRNHVVRKMSTVSNALDKHHTNSNLLSGGASEFGSDAFILQQLETTVMNLRSAIATYSRSLPIFKGTLSAFWSLSSCDANVGIRHIGYQLSTQMMDQLDWDSGLMKAVIHFINEEIYSIHSRKNEVNNMRVYTNAISAMLRIDKSFWKLVEQQTLDELKCIERNVSNSIHSNKIGKFFNLEDIPVLSSNDQDDSNDHKDQSFREARSLHELTTMAVSLEEAMDGLLQSHLLSSKPYSYDNSQFHPLITSMILIGEEGCGKTFLLDSLEQKIKELQNNQSNIQSVLAIRPTHQDFAGNTVGSSEDRWISLFSYAESQTMNDKIVLLLLDDIDTMLSLNELGGVSSTRFQVGKRCKTLFLSILDRLQSSGSRNRGQIVLFCTSRSRCEDISGRFDRVFTMNQMNDVQRQQMIVSCLSARSGFVESTTALPDDNINDILSLAVKHSAGRTAFELSQCCRDVLLSEAVPGIDDEKHNICNLLEERIYRLDKMMQTRTPQSLRGGSLDGIVDMIVLTPEELVSRLTTNEFGDIKLPLLGSDAKRAFESMMDVVVTPLCCSEKISSLLYGGAAANDNNSGHMNVSIRVGALLAGGPGTGKTTLAYHCASLAAQMSRFTLLDVTCTSLIHKEIGGSERAVRRLFEAVRAASPCILLLDGIENVAPRRGNDCTTEGTMDRVLSTFLTEMDGIGDGRDVIAGNVGVIGITYNPELIDPSLLRPGRLEKTIKLGTPDFEARKELVSHNIIDLQFDFSSAGYFDPKNRDDIAQHIAIESVGMSAVETIAICKEASMVCLRELNFEVNESDIPLLNYNHFKTAIKIMKGKERNALDKSSAVHSCGEQLSSGN